MKVVIYRKINNTQGIYFIRVYSIQVIHKNMVLGLLAFAGDQLYMACGQHYGSDQDTESVPVLHSP